MFFRKDTFDHFAKEQRVFIYGRKFLFNVVEADAQARIFAHTEPQCSIPVIAGYDFGTAFTSLSYEWLLVVLKAFGFPHGFCNVISGQLRNVQSYSRINGSMRRMYHIICGIIQGCVTAGLCVAAAVDPSVRKKCPIP